MFHYSAINAELFYSIAGKIAIAIISRWRGFAPLSRFAPSATAYRSSDCAIMRQGLRPLCIFASVQALLLGGESAS